MQKPRTSGFSESPRKKQLPSPNGRCGKTLVGYQDAAFDIRKLEEEEHQEYPEDEMDESDLASLLSLDDGSFFDINVYVDKIYAMQTRPLGENRTVPVQEVAVRDAQQKKCLLYFLSESIGSVKAGKYYLVKNGRVFANELQVWGYSMVAEIPGLFDVIGNCEEVM